MSLAGKVKFIKPKIEQAPSNDLKYDVQADGTVDNVRTKDDSKQQAPPVKNKGGRPKGSGRKKEEPLDVPIPLNLADIPPAQSNEPASPKNKGGRPPKNGGKKPTGFQKEAFAKQFMGLHKMISFVIPGVDMTYENALMVSESFEVFKEEWGIEVNAKITSLIGLAGAIAIAESGNVMAVINERKRAKIHQAANLAQIRAQQQKIQNVAVGEPMNVSRETHSLQLVEQRPAATSTAVIQVPEFERQIPYGEPMRG